MFYSQCLLSRKGSLGVIWVAAYCFKRLKKAQVFTADISSSVDEILQKELDVMTYRVLAYLLLGLVRIYSKKVEYLCDDCQDAMIKINDFVVSQKSKTHLKVQRAPFYSITLPDRFELDAFDLEIVEDAEDADGDNVLPYEEITLKDGASNSGRSGSYSLGKYPYEEFSAFDDSYFTEYTPTEDFLIFQSMEIDMDVSTSHDLSILEASLEKHRGNSSSQDEWVNLDTFCGNDGEHANSMNLSAEDQNIDGGQIKVPVIVQPENRVEGDASTERHQNNKSPGGEEEPLDLVQLHSEDNQSDRDQMKVPHPAQSEEEMCQAINEDNNLCNLQAITEKLLDHSFLQEISMDVKMLHSEDNQSDEDQMKVPHMAQSEEEMCQAINEDNNLCNLQASTEKLLEHTFLQEVSMDVKMLHSEDNQSDGDQMTVPHMALSEEEMCRAINEDNNLCNLQASTEKLLEHSFLQEVSMDVKMLHSEDNQSDGDQMKVPHMAKSEKEMCQAINEDNNLSNLPASPKKPLDHRFPQEVSMDVEMVCGFEEERPELFTPSCEEHHVVQMNSVEMSLSRDGKCHSMKEEDPVSTTVDATPQYKFPDASGATTPEFMLVPTPATKDRAPRLRKRKCCLDDVIIFPNNVMKRCLEDASDLVSKRRKAPPTALSAWKAFRISNLSQGFLVPLLPCISSELSPLFCLKKSKILETAETVQSPKRKSSTVGKSLEQIAIPPETPTGKCLEEMAIAPETPAGSVEKTAIAPETPVGSSLEKTVIAPETPSRSLEKMAIAPEEPTGRSSEQQAVAPETPVLHSREKRLFETPESQKASHSDAIAQDHSFQDVEKEPSSSKDQDCDLNLLEEPDSCETDNSELDGFSVRTRMVVRYLHRRFQNPKKGGENETVNLMQLLEGKTKKESARLFYEILVLKSKGYVDVKQEDANGDMLVLKVPKWDQSCAVLCL
ncbi:hypothetical protein Dsin_031052 [Dipteronia sinensis]|uniref:Sister chromatid cohesion 1 protein 2 n=1 Tax=Dipteronia sinensis TaxID=43782 RepID=A0AAE0DRR3_9ROSI|nr:hypothetical protein Dsin_031052 [Dipteronia sinensis]